MKSILSISTLVLAAMLVMPQLTSAEDVSGSASTVTTVAGTETSTGTGVSTGKRQHGEVTITKQWGAGMKASGTKPMPAGMDVRNKMIASGTKPLPPGMEQRMMHRDQMGSGTPKCVDGATGTKCSQMNDRNMQDKPGSMMKKKGDALKHKAGMQINRMKAAIERLEKISVRLDTRIQKLNGKGIDTTNAVANVAIARAKIDEAKVAVALAQSLVASAAVQIDASASSTKPIDAGKPIREALEKARQSVFAAHKALVEAIASVKANVKTADLDSDGKMRPKAESQGKKPVVSATTTGTATTGSTTTQ